MKKIMLGIILGLLIGMAGTAIASTNETVQAVFAKFNIQINQDEAVSVEALVHEGTSYYPIRVIADLLEHEVGYDTNTRTISLKSESNIELKPNPTGSEDESEEVDQTESDEIVESTETYPIESIESSIRLYQNGIRAIDLVLDRQSDEIGQGQRDELEMEKSNLQAELQYWLDLKEQYE